MAHRHHIILVHYSGSERDMDQESEIDEKNGEITNGMIETALGFGLEDNRWGVFLRLEPPGASCFISFAVCSALLWLSTTNMV
jgi:hypothetical protein